MEKHLAILESLKRGKIRESVSRYCHIYKAKDKNWYLELAHKEYGDYEQAYTYGPFSTEKELMEFLNQYPNPGGYSYDPSGKQKVPKKSPNGKPVEKPESMFGMRRPVRLRGPYRFF